MGRRNRRGVGIERAMVVVAVVVMLVWLDRSRCTRRGEC